MNVSIRFATVDDVGPIMETLEGYFRESSYHDMDPMDIEQSILFIAECVEKGHVILGDCEGKIGGVVLCGSGLSFWSRPELFIHTFYVMPEWRGTEMGRMLVKALVQIIKKHNYMFATAASTSGFGSTVEKQFENMLVREGFTPMGRACIYFNREES